uniref:Uncharacterized protein n=1 Tax=viral metagenome TaxID=1070528 RepID=A0A6C0C0V4_9ZZZZ
MSCLNNTICGNKHKYYYEWCNYYANDGFYYQAAPNITCTRDNIADLYPTCTNCWTGFIDCCADNIEECCIPSQTSFPTSTPTSSPTTLCNVNHYFQEHEKCYFLEIQNTDISYYTEFGMVCCTNDRSKCCPINPYILYGGIGALCLTIIILFTYLLWNFIPIRSKPTKVMPENKLARIVPV